MNNENDISGAQRRSADSPPSPVFRRTKSVRASFRMLSSRWKASGTSSSSGSSSSASTADKNEPNAASGKAQATRSDSTKHAGAPSADTVSERFGKDFNRILKQPMAGSSDKPQLAPTARPAEQLPPINALVKQKMRFFNAFAKENAGERYVQYEIPKNVAPKAAALLQIPTVSVQQQEQQRQQFFQRQQQFHHHNHHQQQQPPPNQTAQAPPKPPNNDLLQNGAKFDVQLDRTACNMIVNSKQFALLKSLPEPEREPTAKNNYRDVFKPATIRRTPYWPSTNQSTKFCKSVEKHSKSNPSICNRRRHAIFGHGKLRTFWLFP